MTLIKEYSIYFIAFYFLLIITILLVAIIVFVISKFKRKKKKINCYTYKGNELFLVENNLDVLNALSFLFMQDFPNAIKKKNESLGFECVKPFDFTEIREKNISSLEIITALSIISKDKELLSKIFKLFVTPVNVEYDFTKDYEELSFLANKIMTDFFFANAGKILL